MKRSLLLIVFSILFTANICFTRILFVPQEYNTIRNAVYASNSNDTILIANGTYQEQIIIQNLPLTLAGAFLFSNDTNDISRTVILPPDSVFMTNRRSVIQINNTEIVKIFGLTIRNGGGTAVNLNPNDTTVFTYLGGCIKIDSSNVIISHCVIKQGTAQMGGGIGQRAGN